MAQRKVSPTYATARERVLRRWGNQARDNLGDVLYQDALAASIFFVLAMQDERIDGETLKRIVDQCHDDLVNEMNP